MTGRTNCNPHRFQSSKWVIRRTRARSIRTARGRAACATRGAEGISKEMRDERRKVLRIASSTPPALSLSSVLNSTNSFPSESRPRTNTGMARGRRGQRRRSVPWDRGKPVFWGGIRNDNYDQGDAIGRLPNATAHRVTLATQVNRLNLHENWVADFSGGPDVEFCVHLLPRNPLYSGFSRPFVRSSPTRRSQHRSGRLIKPERDWFGVEIHMHFLEHSQVFSEILRCNPASLNAMPTSLSAEG